VDCLEITAEHFFDAPETAPASSDSLPVYVHGLGLSLGTPGGIEEEALSAFAAVVERARPKWVSDHVAYTRMGGFDLGHLNPLPKTREAVRVIADNARRVADRCRRPMLLENITSHLDPGGDMTEPDFLNAICRGGECSLLLDVTNLLINSRNLRFDPARWLDELDRERVLQLHVVGYGVENGRWVDHHSAPMQDDLLELIAEVLRRCPVESVILERDGRLSELNEITSELAKLRALVSHE
jgi:uncharacterized protein (UPF0276 family)